MPMTVSVEDALDRRHFREVVPMFCELSMQSYTSRRLGTAARRRFMPG
jgi:hypothetical protein